MKKIIIFTFIISVLLGFFMYCYAYEEDSLFVWANDSTSVKTLDTSSSPLCETEDTDSSNSLGLESGSACLIEQSTGKVLYNHNMHEKLRPASVTKVMSLLLIMEAVDSGRISYSDMVPCTEDAASMGGSQIWLDVRESLTVSDMIKAICVVSANDCDVQ